MPQQKIKIDFSVPYRDRRDVPVKFRDAPDQTVRLADRLSGYLETAQGQGIPFVKFIGWCKSLDDGGILELDQADFRLARSYIDGEQRMQAIEKFRLNEALDEAEKVSKETK